MRESCILPAFGMQYAVKRMPVKDVMSGDLFRRVFDDLKAAG